MKILRLFNKIFWIILKSNLKFLKPEKKKILIFDYVNSEILRDYLPEKDKSILYTRKEELNLFILFLNFIRGKFTPLDYFQLYIDTVKPKLIITCIDNNPLFYKLKINNQQKKIVIATTWRTPVHDSSIFQIENSKIKVIKDESYNVDYVFTLNKNIGDIFYSLNAKKVITIGSFKSNHHIIKTKKNLELLFISGYNNTVFDEKITQNVNYKKYDSYQIILLQNILKYINKNNIKISILGKKPDNLAQSEFNYFKSIFKNSDWNFIKASTSNSYEVVDRSNIIITLNSTLGYESLSRKNKTIFFDARSKLKDLEPLKFAWPDKTIERTGPFWTNDESYSSFERIVNNIKNMNYSAWESLVDAHIDKIMIRNENNSDFKKIINQYI